MMAKRVAVIGAGASGLAAIKSCLDEDLTPVCFERTDHLGGLWYYTEHVYDGQACVMKSTVINTSKEVMCYSDFPIPAEYPMYMHNTKVVQYFRLYADSFGADQYIRYNTAILKVCQAQDFVRSGQWQLTVHDRKTDQTTEEVFDAVLVCTGHHADKNIPKFEGLENFRGKVVHTHDYRHHMGYEDKKVVIVGIGNSGGDVAVELSRIASHVSISTRRGTWVINRISDNGLPGDIVFFRRSFFALKQLLPRSVWNTIAEKGINSRFDHENYGLKPKHRMDAAHATINDELPNRIACGSVVIRKDIRQINASSVEYVDGSVDRDVDVIILATGYTFGFPFIDHPALECKDNQIDLYMYMFPLEIQPSTLAVIGCVQPIGATMPISEMQCRWATRVFKGLNPLPSAAEMKADMECKRAAMRAQYVNSRRHTIQVDYIVFMDELADKFGVKPKIGRMLLTDPKLALRCYFGPYSPYQYRITGPGTWSGARQAILTIMDRTLAGLNPARTVQPEPERSFLVYFVVFALLAIVFSWGFGWIC